jgi:hypothetical protein
MQGRKKPRKEVEKKDKEIRKKRNEIQRMIYKQNMKTISSM